MPILGTALAIGLHEQLAGVIEQDQRSELGFVARPSHTLPLVGWGQRQGVRMGAAATLFI